MSEPENNRQSGKQENGRGPGVLSGLRVLDIAHQYSGALAGALLADLGADVITVEHPAGSPIRTMLPKKDGESLWWKVTQRNKRAVTLNLSRKEGRELFLRMASDVDMVVENFRPGTLEKWCIGPADLEAAGLNLVLLRISGFGQYGPLHDLPGFGTVAECISGFANLNGFPEGPPTLPSTTLADGVAGLFGAFGALASVLAKRNGSQNGISVVDMALFEGLFRLIPTQVSTYDQTGTVPSRPGNFLGSHGVLRNLYRTRDGRYLCVSAVGPQAMRRILVGAGADDLVREIDKDIMNRNQPEIEDFLEACDKWLSVWSSESDFDALAGDLSAAGAVYSRVYDVVDIVNDPHYRARGDLVEAPDASQGSVLMQGVIPKFSAYNHDIRSTGGAKGRDNREIFEEKLGLGTDEIALLKEAGVI